jgi:hypothetical protein
MVDRILTFGRGRTQHAAALQHVLDARTCRTPLIKQGGTRRGSLLQMVLICLPVGLGHFNQAAPT